VLHHLPDLRAHALKLSRLIRTWEGYGRRDPFFGVLSDPSKHGGRWHADEFFASGVAHVENLRRSLADARIAWPGGAALDFGCGVGRLTQALAPHVDRVTGVDVARSMIRQARRFNRFPTRCTYVVNRHPDLRTFASGSLDLVHSCIALQHMPPELSLRYVEEFFRICKTGGLVVFQAPSAIRSEDESPLAFALPDDDYRAGLALAAPLPAFSADTQATIGVRVTNLGQSVWPENTPTGHAGRIMLANHWLRADGSVAARDDGRGALPRAVWPGDTVDVPMVVTPPAPAGSYMLEIDLVQELVTWFGDKGSTTLSVPVDVADRTDRVPKGAWQDSQSGGAGLQTGSASAALKSRRSIGLTMRDLIDKLVTTISTPAPPFAMHVLPRADVEVTIARAGGTLVRAIEDDACGPKWRSLTYVSVRR
jgi:SAM-dependent methyltransferase